MTYGTEGRVINWNHLDERVGLLPGHPLIFLQAGSQITLKELFGNLPINKQLVSAVGDIWPLGFNTLGIKKKAIVVFLLLLFSPLNERF